MCGDDGVDQREPQAVAATVVLTVFVRLRVSVAGGAGAGGVAASKALEGVVDELEGEAGTVVVHVEAARVHRDRDGGTGGRGPSGGGGEGRPPPVEPPAGPPRP